MPWTKRCFLVSLTETSAYISPTSNGAQHSRDCGSAVHWLTLPGRQRRCQQHCGRLASVKRVIGSGSASITARPSAAGWALLPRPITRESTRAAGWASRARCASVLAPIHKSGALWSGTIRIKLKACFTFLCSTALLCRINCPEVGYNF